MRRDYGYFEEDKLGKPYDVGLMRRLLPFLKPYRFLFATSVLLVTVVTALDLALPYLTKIAIDAYIVKDMTSSKEATHRDQRMYPVDLSVQENQSIVDRYPQLFTVTDAVASIAYSDLHKLQKSDLLTLRRADLAGVGWIALGFLGIVLGHFFLSFVNVMVLEYAGQSIMHHLRLELFEHVQGLSIAFFSKNPVGRLVTRVTSDVQNLHEFFTSIITVLFKDVFLLVGITSVLIAMNWKLALVCFIMLPLVFFTTAYFSRLARDVFRELRIKVAELNAKIQESIDGIRIIQLFRNEKRNYGKFRNLNHENYKMGMRQIHIFAVFLPTIEVLSAVTTALVLWYGGLRVMDETITLGVLVAFVSYMKMFFRPIRDLAEKYNIMQSAMASCERIFLLFDTKKQIPEPVGEGPSLPPWVENKAPLLPTAVSSQGQKRRPIVEYDRVWFAYEDDDWVIRDFTLQVFPGETVAIVGPTGAGKSTLVHLLERFYDPVKGVVRIGGVDLRRMEEKTVREQSALIAQDVFIFADTLRNNISTDTTALSKERLDAIIQGCNLDRVMKRLPDGLDTVMTEAGRTLSSGERQLVAFARALAKDAAILVLDEATSSIDTETERLIQEATLTLMEGRTAIVVAHRLSTIRHADRIVVMHHGRIEETGSHEDLMALKGLYFKLYQWQAISTGQP